MSNTRNLAGLLNSSGNVPDAKLVALAATKLTGQVPDANAPSGSVIQVVSTLKTNSFTSTATGFNDVPGLSATITPSSTNSKIMVIANVTGGGQSGTTHIQLKLLRNSTDIAIGDQGSGSTIRATTHIPVFRETDSVYNHPMFVLDSPNTTSAVTYKVQFRNNNSSGTIYINRTQGEGGANTSTTVSSITLMEIAA
jgi:hypothetical protein